MQFFPKLCRCLPLRTPSSASADHDAVFEKLDVLSPSPDKAVVGQILCGAVDLEIA